MGLCTVSDMPSTNQTVIRCGSTEGLEDRYDGINGRRTHAEILLQDRHWYKVDAASKRAEGSQPY